LSGSPRTLSARADAAGGTAVKFYELRDNLFPPDEIDDVAARNVLSARVTRSA
jgi:hypothetical protein